MLVPKTSGLTRDRIGPSYLLQGRGLVSRGAKRPPGDSGFSRVFRVLWTRSGGDFEGHPKLPQIPLLLGIFMRRGGSNRILASGQGSGCKFTTKL